ncbi:MAG TPA: lyase family protein, partial [Vampirovibrionales bacterium]
AEELILWSSEEFGFVKLDDRFATGSSMMPQKKNPDLPELLRGKSGRVIGNLQALLVVLKGLPLAYNKDLQEDKEGLFDSFDTIKICLEITARFLESLTINAERTEEVATNSFMNATDAADFLVKKGVPFREAYFAVGKAVGFCAENKKLLTDLRISDWKVFHEDFSEEVLEKMEMRNCMEVRESFAGTSPTKVRGVIPKAWVQIKSRENALKSEREKFDESYDSCCWGRFQVSTNN